MKNGANLTDLQTICPPELNWERFEAGTTNRCWLSIPIGLMQPCRIPAIIVRGGAPGPSVVAVAGVHGDEFEGLAALPAFAQELSAADMRGNLMTLPLCNPFAFEAQTRETPSTLDGRNLAREFPGDPAGTATQRLASVLFELASRLLGPDDIFVDLHSAGTRYRYERLVGFRDINGPAREHSQNAARNFGGTLWKIFDQPGSFSSEITRMGIPSVAAEAPGQGGCHAADVEWYVQGMHNLLKHLDMLDGAPTARNDRPPGSPTELPAEYDGLFSSGLRPGDTVAAGDEVGRICSLFGDVLSTLHAPHSGTIWALRTFGSVRAGDYSVWVTP
jgi:predicted deacylase